MLGPDEYPVASEMTSDADYVSDALFGIHARDPFKVLVVMVLNGQRTSMCQSFLVIHIDRTTGNARVESADIPHGQAPKDSVDVLMPLLTPEDVGRIQAD